MAKIIETPTLETARLILRPLSLEDAPALEKYFNNWNIIKHLNDTIPWPYPKNESYNFYKNDALPRVAKGEAFLWTITLDDKPIGLIELAYPNKRTSRGDRGFWLAEPYWGQSYMTEALFTVNDFMFHTLNFKSIHVQNYSDNVASRRVKEKSGAIFLGTKTEKWRAKDREVELWELTAENWKKFKEENA